MGEFTARVVEDVRRRGDCDLVHANFWMSGLVAADLKRARGIPFVVTFHALGRVRRRFQGDADRFPDERFATEDRIVAEADALIAECPQDRADLRTLYRAEASRIVTVPCGFDPEELWPVDRAAARRALRLPAHERIVLQLGRLVPRKGVDNAVRGFALLRRVHGIEARLLIVGGESNDPDARVTPEIGRLERIAREEGVDRHVTFVGRRGRDVLRQYYGAADVFVTTPR
jgi:glycosyltransferase involved in cell wall biosynthesis